MEDLKNASMFELNNLLYNLMVESGADRPYASWAADFAESKGRAYCLELIQEFLENIQS